MILEVCSPALPEKPKPYPYVPPKSTGQIKYGSLNVENFQVSKRSGNSPVEVSSFSKLVKKPLPSFRNNAAPFFQYG